MNMEIVPNRGTEDRCFSMEKLSLYSPATDDTTTGAVQGQGTGICAEIITTTHAVLHVQGQGIGNIHVHV